MWGGSHPPPLVRGHVPQKVKIFSRPPNSKEDKYVTLLSSARVDWLAGCMFCECNIYKSQKIHYKLNKSFYNLAIVCFFITTWILVLNLYLLYSIKRAVQITNIIDIPRAQIPGYSFYFTPLMRFNIFSTLVLTKFNPNFTISKEASAIVEVLLVRFNNA